ncbi:hypothetical protein SAMN05660368_03343 [Marvinbryantia formatexigens]|nr:hypothetical protein SAMN05660368_03343 [Marvinbryantia formatexigens]
MEKKTFSATLSFCHKHTEGMSDYSVSFNSSLEKSKRNCKKDSFGVLKRIWSFVLSNREKILMTFTGSCPVWMSSLLLEFLAFVFSCIFLQ